MLMCCSGCQIVGTVRGRLFLTGPELEHNQTEFNMLDLALLELALLVLVLR